MFAVDWGFAGFGGNILVQLGSQRALGAWSAACERPTCTSVLVGGCPNPSNNMHHVCTLSFLLPSEGEIQGLQLWQTPT